MQYIMKGGNPLVGEVVISGAKNAALGILAAAIMTDEPVLIENLPDVQDIRVLPVSYTHLDVYKRQLLLLRNRIHSSPLCVV